MLAGGHKLIATARNPTQPANLAERYGDQVRAVALDVTDARVAGNAIRTAADAFDPVFRLIGPRLTEAVLRRRALDLDIVSELRKLQTTFRHLPINRQRTFVTIRP